MKCTKGGNGMKSMPSNIMDKNLFPMSLSERANERTSAAERAVEANRAEPANE